MGSLKKIISNCIEKHSMVATHIDKLVVQYSFPAEDYNMIFMETVFNITLRNPRDCSQIKQR